MKKAITESMNVHTEWYELAKKQTIESLPEFANKILDGYIHDYGTICHAISAISIASAWAANAHPNAGITGFQAGAVMWEFIKNWTYTSNKTGLIIVDYDKMMYPQYEDDFQKTISENTFKNMQKECAKLLAETERAHPEVVNHWQSIVNGIVPFGYVVKD
jgi:hypothetical protein